jgi:hypothetical protein
MFAGKKKNDRLSLLDEEAVTLTAQAKQAAEDILKDKKVEDEEIVPTVTNIPEGMQAETIPIAEPKIKLSPAEIKEFIKTMGEVNSSIKKAEDELKRAKMQKNREKEISLKNQLKTLALRREELKNKSRLYKI